MEGIVCGRKGFASASLDLWSMPQKVSANKPLSSDPVGGRCQQASNTTFCLEAHHTGDLVEVFHRSFKMLAAFCGGREWSFLFPLRKSSDENLEKPIGTARRDEENPGFGTLADSIDNRPET